MMIKTGLGFSVLPPGSLLTGSCVCAGGDLQGRLPGRTGSEREAEPEEGGVAGPADQGRD